jgi:DNA-binding transcriptional LysR family regulator
VGDQGTQALASIEQGLQQVEVMKGLEQVELVISTNAHFSVSVAAQAVAKLIPQHPGAHFQINSELPRDAAIRFNEHHSDFFIGTEGELNQNNNAQSITRPWPDIAYIVREGHPLLSLPEIRLSDCLAYPLMAPRPPIWWEEYFRDWALGIGVPLPTGYENTSPFHRAQSTDWATILTLCRACDGITGGCRSQMQSYESEGFVIIEPIDAPPLPDANMILAWPGITTTPP